jgi:hypothetical protein
LRSDLTKLYLEGYLELSYAIILQTITLYDLGFDAFWEASGDKFSTCLCFFGLFLHLLFPAKILGGTLRHHSICPELFREELSIKQEIIH